jgi:RNA polymerase sigma-70 factor (ECF subfamily)
MSEKNLKMSTEQLWLQFHSKLKSFIYKRVAERAAAEDILQDVFLKIHLKSNELDKVNNLQGWVYTITQNQIIDYYRKSKVQSTVTEDFFVPEERTEHQHQELAKCLVPFVNELPQKYKTALLKTDLGGVSQKKFAEEAGISYTGAKSQVQRARKQLKELFLNCCTIHVDKYGTVTDYYDRDHCENC